MKIGRCTMSVVSAIVIAVWIGWFAVERRIPVLPYVHHDCSGIADSTAAPVAVEAAIPRHPAAPPRVAPQRAHERLQGARPAKARHVPAARDPRATGAYTVHRLARLDHAEFPVGAQTFTVVRNELLIRSSDNACAEDVQALLSRHDLNPIACSRDVLLEKLGFWHVAADSDAHLAGLVHQLRRETDGWIIEPNPVVTAFGTPGKVPDDPMAGDQWSLIHTQAFAAWSLIPEGATATVAVVDSGVDLDHPDLRDSLLPGYNLVDPAAAPADDHGHGTRVAGIVGAVSGNAIGIAGMARGVRLLPIKALDAAGEGTGSAVAAGIVHAADRGADVINLSLGTYYPSALLEAAVDYAIAQGSVVVAAMGNSGLGAPAFPAGYPGTLAVGGVDARGQPCPFSNASDCLDLVAPATSILTTAAGGGYDLFAGTSAACAHASALAAMVRMQRPDADVTRVTTALLAGAIQLDGIGWRRRTGFGAIACTRTLQAVDAMVPEVAIVDLHALPATPKPGQEVTVLVTVRNHSARRAANLEVSLQIGDSDVDSALIERLGGKSVADVALVCRVPLESMQGDLIEAAVTLQMRTHGAPVLHRQSVRIPVVEDSVADAVIADLTVDGVPRAAGDRVPLRVAVVNRGNVALTGGRLELRNSNGGAIASQDLADLGPGAGDTLALHWTVPDDSAVRRRITALYRIHAVLEATPSGMDDPVTASKTVSFAVRRGDAGTVVAFHTVAEGRETHQWIAEQGYEYFRSQVAGADIAPHVGTIPGSFIVTDSKFIEGTYAQDQSNRPPLYQVYPFFNHFCAGADDGDLRVGLQIGPFQYDSALRQAERIWAHAVEAYDSDKGRAFFYLGNVAHLVGDMTVPAHTHNDPHPFGDAYEDTIGLAGNFRMWSFGGGRSGHWEEPLSLHEDLETLFYHTVKYTSDYDSDDEYGNAPPYYAPPDYPDTDHFPHLVDRTDGIDFDEVLIVGDDLMPYAIRRTADLIRLFYSVVDTSPAVVAMTYPGAVDMDAPVYRNTWAPFQLTADAHDPDSGILKNGYQFVSRHWDGHDWSEWLPVTEMPGGPAATFTPTAGDTWYAFSAWAENGGGRMAAAPVTYLAIDTMPPDPPRITAFGDRHMTVPLESGRTYTHPAPHFVVDAADAGSGIAGYHVYWGTSETADPAVWIDEPAYTASTLTAPGVYFLHVQAEDNAGNRSAVSTFVYDFRLEQPVLTVTADSQRREYGDPNPALTLSYSGFLHGDDVDALDNAPGATTAADTQSGVGTYDIIPGGGHDRVYAFAYVSGILTVEPAPLTCAADDKRRPFGSLNPPLTISYSGLKNDDPAPAVQPLPACPADAGSPPGPYPITITGGADANYELHLVPGMLTVLDCIAMRLQVERLGQTIELEFGELAAATDAFDPHLDVAAGPLNNGGPDALEAVFVSRHPADTVPALLRDYRPPAETTRWTVLITGLAPASAATVTWDIEASDPDRTLYLQRIEQEQAVGYPVDMSLQVAHEVTGEAILEIAYAPFETVEIGLSPGWNLVGNPLMTTSSAADFLAALSPDPGTVPTPVYVWENGRYRMLGPDTPLLPERAHWIHLADGHGSGAISGVRADGIIELRPGWNAVSPPADTLLPAQVDIASPVWTWDANRRGHRAVEPTEPLQAGRGYWIFLNGAHPQTIRLNK